MAADNYRALYYTITAAARKQLGDETSQFERVMNAIARVLETV